MKTKAKNALVGLKNNYQDNKSAYYMGALAIAAIALQQSNRKAFYAFLVEKGIDPQEYYCPEAFAEKNQ